MIEQLIENPFVQTAAYYSVAVLAIIVSLAVFETVTRYNNWEEIKNGNCAVALATSGKIFGISNVFRYSISYHDSLLSMLVWGMYGFGLLLFCYFMFEFLTPKFKVDEEIARDNRAVGFIAFILAVGLSYVIGASIVAR
ncbi:DUF350 domain-containing protein [Desertibacillus haloalkaliphilus]|uniref:DUF350 domain-containing protein n=1 Tax=Desertibacillus haloalkaliphilus TaxID=1328930 RepID=UPI001C261155|nr:DUF350 domain-containing protein [Desertibacillus haloalkaliphilus]MBU8905112.1 DUF350 domain-containing protein [Desertibacillus haloalkaliphilus]